MDATSLPGDWPWASACRTPEGLSEERLGRWCLRRTEHDRRLAAFRGRPMSGPAYRRRLTRRTHRAMLIDCGPAPTAEDDAGNTP